MVAMRGDLDEFREMIDFASVPDENIGSMNSPTVLVSTFTSKFSMFELEDLFKSVKEVNFFIMDVDESGIHIVSEDVRKTLMSVFNGFDKKTKKTEKLKKPLEIKIVKKTPKEIEDDYPEIYKGVVDEYDKLLNKMSKKEKGKMMDSILDRLPELSSTDRALLEILSRYI